MKDDFFTNFFFWLIASFFLGFFAWVAVDELIYLQMENEQEQIMMEFNEKYD